MFHDPHKARPLTLLTSVARVWVRAPTSYSPFYGTPRVPSAVAGAREGGREEEEEEGGVKEETTKIAGFVRVFY